MNNFNRQAARQVNVAMPSHVHLLVIPETGHSPKDILHSWKSFTANALNRADGRTGPVWQEESFDHIVRNYRQLKAIEVYIDENPTKANLKPGEYDVGGRCVE
jgi:REP element-mobilizing transposase RayT